MKMGIMSSLMALLAGASLGLAQPADAPTSTAPAPAQPPAAAALIPAPPPLITPPPEAPFTDGGPAGSPRYTYLPDYGPGFGPAPMGNCFYGSAEYLLWKIKDAPLPAPQLTIPFTISGINSFSNTFTLGNGVGIEYGGRSGGRFTIGGWVKPEQLLGIEATYFQLERRNDAFGATQVADIPQSVTINESITVAAAVAPTIQQITVTLPTQLTTTVTGSAGITNFYGGELNARSTRCFFGGAAIDLIGGFRYIEFDENLSLFENATLVIANPQNFSGPGPIPPNPLPPIVQPVSGLKQLAAVRTDDSISTRNQFYGAQVGASFEWWIFPRLMFNGWGKVGTGAMVETIRVVGDTVSTGSSGTVMRTPGGILTPSTGFIDFSQTRYVVVPEFNINLAYQVTKWARFMVGYNFLFLSSVARPGDQIGISQSNAAIAIQGTGVPATVNSPSFRYLNGDLWAQGLTAGFQIRY